MLLQSNAAKQTVVISHRDIKGYMPAMTMEFHAKEIPDLAPGTYDVELYDFMQEVDRLPKALTILPTAPTPTVEMQVAGAFRPVSDDLAKLLTVGLKFPPTNDIAEILSVTERCILAAGLGEYCHFRATV